GEPAHPAPDQPLRAGRHAPAGRRADRGGGDERLAAAMAGRRGGRCSARRLGELHRRAPHLLAEGVAANNRRGGGRLTTPVSPPPHRGRWRCAAASAGSYSSSISPSALIASPIGALPFALQLACGTGADGVG